MNSIERMERVAARERATAVVQLGECLRILEGVQATHRSLPDLRELVRCIADDLSGTENVLRDRTERDMDKRVIGPWPEADERTVQIAQEDARNRAPKHGPGCCCVYHTGGPLFLNGSDKPYNVCPDCVVHHG